ncbi:unnamed protein product [Fusarium graminearum]|uniref:Uncharacterized protein n=1 Tax=Gibberella zeae TaxID=5518 RepID=A0A9N8RLW0_GIBZA|nr:unnamed protein product [Fusarium graminearum]
MAGTSVDEAQNYCLKRRTRDGTASAQKQQEALNRVSEYPRREEEETKVGVGKRTAQMWRERGTKRGRERKRERERGTNFDVVQVRVELQKIRDQGTQGACESRSNSGQTSPVTYYAPGREREKRPDDQVGNEVEEEMTDGQFMAVIKRQKKTHTRSRQLFNVNAHKTSNPMHKHKINESSQDPVRFEATRRQPTTDNGEPAIPWSESMHLWFRRTHSSVSVYV